MKAHDIFELAEKIAALKKPEDKPMTRNRRRASRHIQKLPDQDVVALLHRKLEEADTLKKVLDDREKANKKEEKKGKVTAETLSVFLMLTYPIIALTLLYLLRR